VSSFADGIAIPKVIFTSIIQNDKFMQAEVASASQEVVQTFDFFPEVGLKAANISEVAI
jgi:hypothetical protein